MDSKHSAEICQKSETQAVQEVLVHLDLLLQKSAEAITAMVGKCSELTKAQGHGKAEALPVLSGSCFNERSTVKKFQ